MQKELAARLAASAYPTARRVGSGWRNLAQCRKAGISLNQLFAASESEQRLMLPVCRGCPVVVDCLAYALRSPFPVSGVWGGTTRWDRTRLVARALRGHCRNCGQPKPDNARFCDRCLRSGSVRTM